MSLQLDPLTDLRLDGDRTVSVGDDGDLETVTGIDNVEQSAGIHTGQALRPLIGEAITPETFSEAETRLREYLEGDPQLDEVQRVVIDRIDKDEGVIELRVFVGVNNDFNLTIDL